MGYQLTKEQYEEILASLPQQDRGAAVAEMLMRLSVQVELLTARAERAEAERDALKEAARPIPVTERLPDKGASVLVFIRGKARQGYLTGKPAWRVWGAQYLFEAVSHWMPLPEL